jgi:hypothetical protein
LRNYRGKAKVVLTLVEDTNTKMHPHTLLIDKVAAPGYYVFDIEGEKQKE